VLLGLHSQSDLVFTRPEFMDAVSEMGRHGSPKFVSLVPQFLQSVDTSILTDVRLLIEPVRHSDRPVIFHVEYDSNRRQ